MDTSAAPISRRQLAAILGGLAMFGPFSIDTIFPAFPAMGAQFAADKLAMQQTISVYLIAYAVMSIVHGPLSDSIGRRRVILGGLAVFTLASVGCAMATDLPTLLAFRALQGFSSGVGLIVGRAVIRDVFQGDDAQRLMSQVSMIFGIAPAIAPIIGGWLLGWSTWPTIFWFLVVFSLVLLLMTWWKLPETHPVSARLPFTPARMVSDYLSIINNRRFLRLTAASAFNFAALWLYISSAPAFVLDILKLNERQFGWFFVPMIGGMVAGAFVSGRAAGRLSGERQIAIGFACSAVAMALNLGYNFWVDVPQLPWAVVPMTLNAFGIAMVFPIVTLAILEMYPRQRGAASSLQAFSGLVLNAAIAGVLSPWISDDAMKLVAMASVFLTLGWLFWRWELGSSKKGMKSIGEGSNVPSETL